MSIVSAVLKSVVVPVKRQFGYVMSSKSYVRDLQKEVENLRDTAERVENAVQARNNLRMDSSRVIEWQRSANNALKEAGDLLDTFDKDSKTCCRGTLPDLNCRYQFSRKVEDKIRLIHHLRGTIPPEYRDISFGVGAPTASPRIERGLRTVSDLLRWPITEIKRLVLYRINCGLRAVSDLLWSSSESYAQDLQKEVGKLAYHFDWVQLAIEAAPRNGRGVSSFVSKWREKAVEALKEAKPMLRDFERKNAVKAWEEARPLLRYLEQKNAVNSSEEATPLLRDSEEVGITPPDPRWHYEFSRKAKDKIEGIQKLTKGISKYKKLEDIFSSARPARGPAPTQASASSTSMSVKLRDRGVFESRALMIQKIMDALADHSNSVVGVYGMGGVGKSTLLEQVRDMLSEERPFDWVAKADVSENPDVKTIQGEIADALGLADIKNKETVSGRAELLRNRLKAEEKVLIILDNLWEGLDLKSVGIPCGPDNKVEGCKLLLTSRSQRLLQEEMGSDREFLLGGLEEEEARALFERTVGDKVHDDEFKPWVEVALRTCAGVPFLIVAMAKRFKNAELFEWKDALSNMKKFNHEEINGLIDDKLKWSYDNLEEEAKALLRLCVVYSVSKPSLENLVRYGVGLGLFQEVSSMEEATDRLRSHIRTLQASALLLDSEDVGGFKIHDLVREFVTSVSSRDHPLLVLKDKDKSITELPKDKLKSCRAVCFPYVDLEELPQELYCPEMRIFLLFENNKSIKIPDSYFNSMRKLMVLHLSRVCFIRSPSPFQFLEDLHTLCLDGCSLEDVAMIGELKGLHILSFVNSKIRRLPKEIGQLVELKLLDLNNCSQLEIIDPGVLESLVKLEELYMESSFDRWDAVEQSPPTNAKLIELNNMKNLFTLHVSILDLSVLPADLNVEKLAKYKIQIGDVQYWPSPKGLRTLQLKLDPTGDILQKGCIQTLLSKTDDLFLDGLNGIEESICALSQKGFPKLKHLQVENSPSIHYVLQSPSHTEFNILESLGLKNLINLEKICNNHISSKSFNALKVVRVQSCGKMEVLFHLSLLRELPQLEEIEIAHCHSMREIVEVDDCDKVELRNLHVLKFRDLPNIKNFVTAGTAPSSSTSNGPQVAFFNGQQVSIPSSESLTMVGLPNLEDIWTDESPLGLTSLQFLEVSSCKSLSKVINSRSLVKLCKLHTLKVEHCDSVQEVFDLDELSIGANTETLSELNTISISKLPSLRFIWNKNPCGIVRFHNLKQLKVYDCNNLGFLFFPSMVQSLTQLRELWVQFCKKMETIVTEDEGLGLETSATLVFPMLTNLSLECLESLMCFSRSSREARSEDCVKSRHITIFDQEVAFPSLETLRIRGMDSIETIWDNQVVVESFRKLKSLIVYNCNKLVNIVPSHILGRLKSLESLEVDSCDSLEVVFKLQSLNPPDGHPVARLPLKNLELTGLSKLKRVWDKELHSQVKFQCLQSITISECKSLTSLFPALVARDLMQLDKLKINDCGGIVELIEKEGLVPRDVFPKLTSLKLKHLPELKCIYRGTHALRWPALKTLKVDGCNKVEILASQSENEMPLHKQPLFLIEKGAFPNLQEIKLDLSEGKQIWHGHSHEGEFFGKVRVLELRHLSKESAISTCLVQSLTNLQELVVRGSYIEELSNIVEAIEGPSHELKVARFFRHLKTLDVSRCDGLSKMFTPTIAGNLVELTRLRISKCKMLTEVICDEGGEEGLVVVFNQLKYMELDELTALRCFSSSKYTLVFPLLEDVTVSQCPSMKFFSEGPIKAPKLERVQVSKEAWFWEENLNITIQNMFKEMAMVPRVRLSEFPELIEKWHGELNPIKPTCPFESLMVDKCPSFTNAIPSRLMLVLNKMQRLHVRNCQSLEEVFDLEGLEGTRSTQVLPMLRNLDLVNLPKLWRLWNDHLQGTMRFKMIFHLTLYNCSNLRHAFTPSMVRCLANLRRMEIKECGQMEGVIAQEEGQGSAMKKITFPKLHWMELECLPNLTSFLSGKNHRMECPDLEELTIAFCPKMRSLTWQSLTEIDHRTPSLYTPQVQFPRLESMVLSHMDNLSKIWTDSSQDTLTFEHLRKVKVDNCKSLENLFPYWVATSLNKFEKLRVECCAIEEIVVRGDDTPHSTTAQVLFPRLTSLVFHDVPQLKSFCPNLPTLNWPFLEKLQVTHCEKLDTLSFAAPMSKWAQTDDQLDLSDQEARSSFKRDFPNLQRLCLVDKDLQMIKEGSFPGEVFGKLKVLTLACFHDENVIFPFKFLLERFQSLQSLKVFCSSFKDIFVDEGLVDEGKHLVLENLRELKLSKLHNLKRVWREDYLVAKILQSIEKFEVWDCPCLTTLFPATTSFQNLTELVVKSSSGLVHLVTVSAVTNLVHLTNMTITGCEKMKEVVVDDGNEEGKLISLGKLERLSLQNLPSLECFSSTPSCSFRFPFLREIEVEECPKMKIFSKGTLSTPQLRWGTLFRYRLGGNLEGDLNTTIQKLSA